MADLERWRRCAAAAPEWEERSRAVGALIRPGERVLDVGAGSMGLRRHLPAGCSYTPLDCVSASPETIVADLDGDLPGLRGFDVAVLCGVLEHLKDPGRCLLAARGWAWRVIFTWSEDVGRSVGRAMPRQAARALGRWKDHQIYELA